MRLAVALTLGFVVAETICGLLGHSLALLSDAGHNFADAAALAFCWYAVWIAEHPANPSMTFGYHRVGILSALVNAVSLVVIAIFIIIEGIDRLRHPQAVSSGLMIGVAAVAIAINVLISIWLHGGAKDDINVRAAYLHMIGDAISAFGVIVAGCVVALTHGSLADPIVSFLIAGLILWSSWGVLKESVGVLLEGTPTGMDMAAVIAAIKNLSGVLDVHDLHVWTVGPGVIACSCHVLVAEQSISEGQQVLRNVVQEMRDRFRITHTTVQVEVEGCEANDMYCKMERSGDAHIGHHH